MNMDKIAMTVAEEFFQWDPAVMVDWLKVYLGLDHSQAVDECSRLMRCLNERQLTPEDAARIGGIIEDSSGCFMIRYLGKTNNYSVRSACNAYVSVRGSFEDMACGLWDGHCQRWTPDQEARAREARP